ncbi:late embryogenesis abundant protein At1g64065-like [Cornus florida]|uniref:late embryogenesis abundant protein At1g64065-like n=1 Tax=Cornus florida TaxID=4283 RepID=UPI00289A5D3C|nr:late embryogenesis abundant protein At1g64065-like [Cornus florida]
MEGKRSSRKCLAYVAIFVVFQTAVILVFALTVMKIKSPKVRFGSITIDNISSTNTNSTSVSMRLNTQFTVKNTNFGHFKYDNSTVTVMYGGMAVGEAAIPSGRAKARQTKRFDIALDISTAHLSGNTNLANDINSGILTLTSQSKLSGKVHLMKVIKKKKSGEMSCTIAINLTNKGVGLKCK